MKEQLLETKTAGCVYELRYALKYKEVTRHTTSLGYFHDLRMLLLAKSEECAVEVLRCRHNDGTPEAIKVTSLGRITG